MRRINALIKDMLRSPYEGIGKPEPLKGEFSGYWSRRIDDFNRIVYRIVKTDSKKHIEIIQCGTHYHK